jgi:parvulin-like peptidyl-prolyl isomerase
MKRRILLTLTPLAALALAAGCGGSGNVPSNAVAVVEKCNTPVTKNDYNQVLNQARVSYQHNKQAFPAAGTQEYRQVQNQVVSYLVLRDAYICEANKMGVGPSSDAVDKRVSQLITQYYKGDKTKYQAALKQQGVSEEQLRQEVAMQLSQQDIFNKVTASASTKVTAKEIQDYYNKNKSSYQTPATRTVRHILVALTKSGKPADTQAGDKVDYARSKVLADQLEQKLRTGASFAALAAKYSQDPGSKKTGGKLSDLAQGQTVPPFDKIAFSIGTGDISQPVKTQFGWHIIQALTAVKPSKKTPLSSVQTQIKQIVAQSKKTEIGQKWAQDFRTNLAKASAVKYQAGFQPPATTTSTTTTG